NTILGRERRSRRFTSLLSEWLGNFRHLWMWDYKAIASELEQVGFSDIRRAVFGDSSDTAFNAAEDESRWLHALGMECRKPQEALIRNAA
ncbi:MAG: hypothetical protein KDA89_24475, partial [Planctomycetaceae bacterium]|nr:hypothetical protein [Planctomycetaceae bacterium]